MATHINEGVSGGKILSWEILVESRDNILPYLPCIFLLIYLQALLLIECFGFNCKLQLIPKNVKQTLHKIKKLVVEYFSHIPFHKVSFFLSPLKTEVQLESS